MTSDVKESLATNEIIGLIVPYIEYDGMLIKVASMLSENYNKILYISVNKSYESLISKFNQNKIDINKFYFTYCVTRTSKDVQSTENCCFVSSPGALDEIQTTILDFIHKLKIDAALIDSPSALSNYYEHMDVLKFLHLLMTKLIVARCKGILPFQRESASSLRKSIEMFTDKVVYLESDKSGSSNPSNASFDAINLLLMKIAWIIRFRIVCPS